MQCGSGFAKCNVRLFSVRFFADVTKANPRVKCVMSIVLGIVSLPLALETRDK